MLCPFSKLEICKYISSKGSFLYLSIMSIKILRIMFPKGEENFSPKNSPMLGITIKSSAFFECGCSSDIPRDFLYSLLYAFSFSGFYCTIPFIFS
jgi:hypothetical protein